MDSISNMNSIHYTHHIQNIQHNYESYIVHNATTLYHDRLNSHKGII